MGLANVVRGTVLKATPDRIQLRWRGQTLEAVNSPNRSYLPAPDRPSISSSGRSTCGSFAKTTGPRILRIT